MTAKLTQPPPSKSPEMDKWLYSLRNKINAGPLNLKKLEQPPVASVPALGKWFSLLTSTLNGANVALSQPAKSENPELDRWLNLLWGKVKSDF